jgi:hypothetical protein
LADHVYRESKQNRNKEDIQQLMNAYESMEKYGADVEKELNDNFSARKIMNMI